MQEESPTLQNSNSGKPERGEQKPEQPEQKEESFFKEIVKFTILALVIVIPIRTYVAQPFVVSGASMDPTFGTGEYLIVDELTYHFQEPTRGQVIIFKFPNDQKTFFIKRIIGLPGERVVIDNGIVTIHNEENPEGLTLNEPYVDQNNSIQDNFSVNLGANDYFVMGDNRSKSSDSRTWGPLERKFIIGRPIIRLLPVTEIRTFPGDYSSQYQL